VADFHRPHTDDAARASTLSIFLGLRADGDDAWISDHEPLRAALERGAIDIGVVAERTDDGHEPTSSVVVTGWDGSAIARIDGPRLLADLRRRFPAVIVGGPRRAARRAPPESVGSPGRARSALLDAADPLEPMTWDRLGQVREGLVQAAAALAEQLPPAVAVPRSVRDVADKPHPLQTDLSAALLEDAEPQRRIAALWLLVAIVDDLPPEGIAAEAMPFLLFDDIEANLPPTWLAALTSVALHLPFQQLVSTYSPEVLSWIPLGSLRRLVRNGDKIATRSVQADSYSVDELRRLTYHLRLNRGNAFFARCWVLVEGETEAWLVPEFGRIAGVEFPVEGIRVIEFAQAGLKALLRLADDLGISWVMLADGDDAGRRYEQTVQAHLAAGGDGAAVILPARDIESYLFAAGYDDVIRKAAGGNRHGKPDEVIRLAIENSSKPSLALEILANADGRGIDGVPPILRELAVTAQRLARG
jgi:putative ATP-dependent endonuclease of OLD family